MYKVNNDNKRECAWCDECNIVQESYDKGKADGAREFAEWFKKSNYYLCYSDTIDDVLAEWQKEQNNVNYNFDVGK